ncbi:hypothetical protein FO519_007030 [Halicephalobus sp. NKZ332]|nr:hypothetical protein FO519_007030 [Halicephalobus sp. NKZ332]
MQLISSDKYYYIQSVNSVLRVSRADGQISVLQHVEFANDQSSFLAIGTIEAVIGKIKVEDIVYLLVVVNSTKVAVRERRNTEIRRIDKVAAVLVDPKERVEADVLESGSNNFSKLKSSQKKFIKFVSGKSTIVQPKLVDEILRLFNDNGDFYFETNGGDLTKNIQLTSTSHSSSPDEGFFWNKQMLSDFKKDEISSEWIVPVIQGFVAQKSLRIEDECVAPTDLTLTLISRRSTKRAGTRYLRRGIDEEANVANFVETELIIDVFSHQLAFVQIRGSVPLFWSQHGYRYRPPLVIDRELKDSIGVFKNHMEKLIEEYGKPLVAVNLVNQAGRELCLAQAFLEHILEMNSSDIGYFSFDFHHHCRALRFHKVNDLITAMKQKITDIGYCWIDKSGELVLRQNGIIRTNCVDCLDRTNVVQGSISQFITVAQFRKLGLISPLNDEIPEALQVTLQELWADNGDAISRQYAGTDALKGDVTRSGQRKITGLVKDGYNSASRYYLSHMRDEQRQKAINAVIAGGADREVEETEVTSEDENESENIGRLVHETVGFVLPEGEILVGGWALVDGDNNNDLVDSILLLTRSHVYIAQYEEQSDKLTGVTTILFDQITKMELGLLGKSQRKHLRIYWDSGNGVLFDTWRAARTRLFNNVAIPLKNGEEADEYVQAICEQLRVTVSMCSKKDVPVLSIQKLHGSASTEKRPIFSGIFGKPGLRTKRQNPSQNQNSPKKVEIQVESETAENERNQESSIPHSQSDSLISGSNLVSKISAKFKSPLWKTSFPDVSDPASFPDPSRIDPFQQYKDQIISSKSLIQML